MNKKTCLLIAGIAAMFVFGLYYFFRVESLPVPPVEEPQPAVNMVYSGNSIIEEKDGKRLWEIGAATMEVNTETKQVLIKDLKGVFYQDNGGKLEIVAPDAVYDTATRELTMRGYVKATDSTGAAFTADTARWSGAERRIYGSGGITVTRGDTVIIGDQIESDANLEKVKVTGNARIRKGGAGE